MLHVRDCAPLHSAKEPVALKGNVLRCEGSAASVPLSPPLPLLMDWPGQRGREPRAWTPSAASAGPGSTGRERRS